MSKRELEKRVLELEAKLSQEKADKAKDWKVVLSEQTVDIVKWVLALLL